MDVKTVFAKNLKALRKGSGLNQERFAEKVGISRPTVGFYENEERTPDIEVLARIAKVHGVSCDDLLFGTVEANKPADCTPLVQSPVNHPPHYTQSSIECIDAIAAATVNLTGIEAVCTGNAIKYPWRWKVKGGLEDLEKAKRYIEMMIERGDKT